MSPYKGFVPFLIAALFSLVPLFSQAQVNAGAAANVTCISFCAAMAAQKPPAFCPQPPAFQTCLAVTPGGVVGGICMPDGCKATSVSKLGGGSASPDSGLSQLGQILGQLMQQLLKAGQSGGSGSGSGSPAGAPPGTTCTTYTPTSDPAQVGANPCVYYVPSSASQINGAAGSAGNSSSASDLLNALNGGGIPGATGPIVPPISGMPGGFSTTTGDNTAPVPSSAGLSQAVLTNIGSLDLAASPASPQQGQGFTSIPGVVGNILFNNNGATIYASTINSANNSALSGFYGSDSPGAQPQGAITSMCQNRPWASNFLSNFIPASFFDSLCQWGGYQVGQPPAPAAPPQVTLTQQAPKKPKPVPAATSSAPVVPPQVQIWAAPSSVTLGARTSIFWRTQGVTSCTETSPDGSFSQNTLQGAGATVPITAATTFTISCIDPSGNPVTSYVTVNLAI